MALPKSRTIARPRSPHRSGARSHDNPSSYRNKKNRNALIEWVAALKKIKCADCPFDGRAFPEAMDFDHLPGTKKRFTISQFVRSSGHLPNARQLLEEEIEKCQVVCANCHRIRLMRRVRPRRR